ncbi:SOS response-associated peptidase [Microtetraspora malaysiensis]|uniref:SOS response-associated peptidase n=1 Tax=Microtetraspora malaysiensis TaxID=161358 RepID=UPI000831D0BE|nr:SOS response-associated peptidase [Microtetraspora malaysiensis]
MCGRYASTRKRDELLQEFEVELDTGEEIGPDYNVAPTKQVYAVMSRVPKEESTERPVRQLRVVRWGLVPSWAKDPSIGSRMINARVETVAEKPAFRRAFASRRCLLPADGFYEWMKAPEGAKPAKQPYFIHPEDGGVMAMAGLYEFWKDPSRADDDPLKWLCTCTVITTDAEDGVGHIHERMPMMIERERWAEWLDPRVSDASRLLVPALAGRLAAYPVSTAVNNVRNNGPDLVEPLKDDGDRAVLF